MDVYTNRQDFFILLKDYILFQPTHMADFSHIQSLQTVVGEGMGKAVLQLRVAGSSELLTITCPSLQRTWLT